MIWNCVAGGPTQIALINLAHGVSIRKPYTSVSIRAIKECYANCVLDSKALATKSTSRLIELCIIKLKFYVKSQTSNRTRHVRHEYH